MTFRRLRYCLTFAFLAALLTALYWTELHDWLLVAAFTATIVWSLRVLVRRSQTINLRRNHGAR